MNTTIYNGIAVYVSDIIPEGKALKTGNRLTINPADWLKLVDADGDIAPVLKSISVVEIPEMPMFFYPEVTFLENK